MWCPQQSLLFAAWLECVPCSTSSTSTPSTALLPRPLLHCPASMPLMLPCFSFPDASQIALLCSPSSCPVAPPPLPSPPPPKPSPCHAPQTSMSVTGVTSHHKSHVLIGSRRVFRLVLHLGGSWQGCSVAKGAARGSRQVRAVARWGAGGRQGAGGSWGWQGRWRRWQDRLPLRSGHAEERRRSRRRGRGGRG